jgi:hypothetical protein
MPNGDVVLEVKDHDAPIAPPRQLTSKSVWTDGFWERVPHKPILERIVLPRATPRKEVDTAKKALLLACELRITSL